MALGRNDDDTALLSYLSLTRSQLSILRLLAFMHTILFIVISRTYLWHCFGGSCCSQIIALLSMVDLY